MRSGFGTVENGFIAARSRIGWPVDIPPSIPPARAVARVSRPLRTTISSCAFDPGRPGRGEPVADLDALHRLDRHQRRGEAGVELAVPMHVGTEPGRHAVGEHLEDAARAVLRLAQPVDLGHHRRATPRRRRTARARRRSAAASSGVGGAPRRAFTFPICTTCDRIWIPELGEERLAERARGHPRRRLAGARPLQDVADVVEPVLQRARQVGVARPRTRSAPWTDRPAPSAAISSAYFCSNSTFGIVIATGAPIVRPWRTPAWISNASASNRWRPPRP